MAEKLSIARAAELETLPVFRDFIEAACRRINLDKQTCYDLKLAVDEACTNIITHGYANIDPGSIILELRLASEQIVVILTDFGHPFEPNEAPRPDVNAALEDHPLGGLGLYFIYNTMDAVDYQTDEEGNRLILTKRRPATTG